MKILVLLAKLSPLMGGVLGLPGLPRVSLLSSQNIEYDIVNGERPPAVGPISTVHPGGLLVVVSTTTTIHVDPL